MARDIRARFSKGKIEPLEEADLREGQEVIGIVRITPNEEEWLKRCE